jgi:hypothetical protein
MTSGLSERINANKERIDRGVGREEHEGIISQKHGWIIPMIVIGALSTASLIIQLIRFAMHQ